MITADLGKVTEVDALSTLKVSGHFRYPYPELNKQQHDLKKAAAQSLALIKSQD